MRQAVLATATLAFVLCTNTAANAQETGSKKKNGLLGWWHQQSTRYQQNRRRLVRPQPAAQKSAQRTATMSRPLQQQQQQPVVTNAVAAQASNSQPAIQQTGLRLPLKSKKSWYQHVKSSVKRQPTQPAIQSQPARQVQPRPVRNVAARQSAPARPLQPVPMPESRRAAPVRNVSAAVQAPAYAMPSPYASMGTPMMQYGMYPQTGAAMYPSPVPNVPHQIGGTAITNQAFYPQELLYPHSYRSMYAPFYYRVRGGWMVTPWGVRSQERWELLGTEVEVDYRSQISPLAGFTPPGSGGFSFLDAIFGKD